MIADRLGIITDEVSPKLDEALDWIAAQGLKHAEIRMVNGRNVMALDDEELACVKKEVSRRGLYVSSIASPVFKCALDPSRKVGSGDTFGQSEKEDVESHFRLLDRAFVIAGLLGAGRIRIFSFWREEEPQRCEGEIVAHLKRAAAEAERRGIMLLLENEPACNGGFAAEVGSLAAAVASPSLRVLWDPGNEAYTGRIAFPDGYDAVRPFLAHVHLKDARIDEAGVASCVPPGKGRVDYVGQLAALQRSGYSGLFTIEPHYVPPGGMPADGAMLCLQGVRELEARARTAG
jgi:sugar phosphate isomerase/epimerase